MRKIMKKRRVLALLLVLAMVLACFSGREMMKAADGDKIIIPTVGTSTNFKMAAGETRHVVIPVRLASWEYTINSSDIVVLVRPDDSNVFELTEAVLTRENVPAGDPVGINSYQTTNVEFDLKIKDTAQIGSYQGNIEFTFSGTYYTENEPVDIKGAKIPIDIYVNKQKDAAQLVADNFTYQKSLAVAGATFDIEFDARNEGEITALNTVMSIECEAGIVPNYSVKKIKIGDMAGKANKHQTLSLRVLPDTEPKQYTIKVKYEYKNADGEPITTDFSEFFVDILDNSNADSDDAKLVAQAAKLNDEKQIDNPYDAVITIENIGKKTAKNIVVEFQEGVGTSSNILPNYPTTGVEAGNLKPGDKKEVKLPLYVTTSASEGLKELKAKVSYEDSKGNIISTTTSVYLTIVVPEKKEQTNDILISQITQEPAAPMPGDILTVNFLVTNSGSNDVKGLQITGDELYSNGFEPLSANTKHEIGDLAVDESKEVTMQFKLGTSISEETNVLKFDMTYTDAENTTYSEPKTIHILNVTKETEEQGKDNIEITNISQSPASPVVGENVTVSFTVENKGTKGITDMKFSGTELGSSGFEPISSEVYKRVGSIEAGASKNVSMTFKLGESIREGFNTLKLEYSYKDVDGNPHTDQTAVYILNVQNQNSDAKSRPKLIVDSFTLSEEELRAGSTFDFTFKLRNTHASKTAKNITVTVMQAEDVFSATKGSNNFYIDSIKPGETAENTINLKVKSDTATGSYDLTIKVAYEYEDMSQADTEKGGVRSSR